MSKQHPILHRIASQAKICHFYVRFKSIQHTLSSGMNNYLGQEGVTIHLQAAIGRGAGEMGRTAEDRVSKNLQTRSQADVDSSNGLFDTDAGPMTRMKRNHKVAVSVVMICSVVVEKSNVVQLASHQYLAVHSLPQEDCYDTDDASPRER